MRILEDGRTTGHRLGVGEITIAAHADGPPQHRHARHDKGFYAMSGTARFTVADTTYDTPAGTFVMILSRSNWDWVGDLQVSGCQAAWVYSLIRPPQDGFSADLLSVDVGQGGAGNVGFLVGDALGDALVRPGGVVGHLVLGQDGAQMPLAGNQYRVGDLAAQGAHGALAGRVQARRPDGADQDLGAGGREDGIE
jgi:hypothetical protein